MTPIMTCSMIVYGVANWLADNLHGRVAVVNGLRIAGLGGVFPRSDLDAASGAELHISPAPLFDELVVAICGEAGCRVGIAHRFSLQLTKICALIMRMFWLPMRRQAATDRVSWPSTSWPKLLK